MRDVNFKGRAFPSFMISMSFFELLLGFKRVVYTFYDLLFCYYYFFFSKLFDGFFIFILMSLIWLI